MRNKATCTHQTQVALALKSFIISGQSHNFSENQFETEREGWGEKCQQEQQQQKKKTGKKKKERRDGRGRKGERKKKKKEQEKMGHRERTASLSTEGMRKRMKKDFQCFWITLPSDSTVHWRLAKNSVLWDQTVELLYHEFQFIFTI